MLSPGAGASWWRGSGGLLLRDDGSRQRTPDDLAYLPAGEMVMLQERGGERLDCRPVGRVVPESSGLDGQPVDVGANRLGTPSGVSREARNDKGVMHSAAPI